MIEREVYLHVRRTTPGVKFLRENLVNRRLYPCETMYRDREVVAYSFSSDAAIIRTWSLRLDLLDGFDSFVHDANFPNEKAVSPDIRKRQRSQPPLLDDSTPAAIQAELAARMPTVCHWARAREEKAAQERAKALDDALKLAAETKAHDEEQLKALQAAADRLAAERRAAQQTSIAAVPLRPIPKPKTLWSRLFG